MKVCPTCFGLYGPEQFLCPKDHTPTEDSVQVLLGRTLGTYEVKSILGEGGMGVVYEGEQPTIGRRVALKVLRPELSLRDDLVERFIQEARAVNTIGHGNIVNIYDFGKTPFGTFYIVMEYLKGDNIRALLDREGIQPLERIRVTVRGVGAALAAAHAKSFIHRDVKPENIMVQSRKGRDYVKLLDFGIVKLTHRPEYTTEGKGLMGTPGYMSPEQLEQSTVDHRADIYSLAAVTYEMLTGEPPYPGKNAAEVRQLQITRTPPPPSVCNDRYHLSRKIDAAVLWALSMDPESRCSGIVDFITAFEDGFQSSQTPGLSGKLQRPRRRPSRLVIGILLGLLAIAGGIGIGLHLSTWERIPKEPMVERFSFGDLAVAKDHERYQQMARARVVASLQSSNPAARARVIELVGKLSRALFIDSIISALQDPDPQVRRAAARTLGRMKDKRAASPLRRALKQSVGYGAIDIAAALAGVGDDLGVKRLNVELAAARDPFRKKYVLHALGALGAKQANAWRELLDAKQLMAQDLRYRALGYLSALGDQAAQQELREALDRGLWSARIQAAKAYAATDRPVSSAVLRRALREAAGAQRASAALLLAQFGDESALPVLLDFSRGPDLKLRGRCLLALGHLPPRMVRDRLLEALRDPSEKDSLSAAIAILQ